MITLFRQYRQVRNPDRVDVAILNIPMIRRVMTSCGEYVEILSSIIVSNFVNMVNNLSVSIARYNV